MNHELFCLNVFHDTLKSVMKRINEHKYLQNKLIEIHSLNFKKPKIYS